MKSQPVSACAFKAKLRNLGICERAGRSAPPRTHRVKTILNFLPEKLAKFSILEEIVV